MGYFSDIMGKLLLSGFGAIDNSLRKRSIRKALENGKYWYAASLCEESGQTEMAGDICFEHRDFGEAMDYYAKANLSHKVMKAATEGYKARIKQQSYAGQFLTGEKKLKTLKYYSVLRQFLEQISPVLNGQNLYAIAGDLETIGEGKLAAEHFLRLAREGEKNGITFMTECSSTISKPDRLPRHVILRLNGSRQEMNSVERGKCPNSEK